MRVPMNVCPVLFALLLPGGVARSEETVQAPPAIAKFTEKKSSHEQYRAAILGKVAFRKGRKPLEPKEPLRVTFARTDVKGAVVGIDVKDGEGFVLQAVPGTWEVREIARAGRLYQTGQMLPVTAGNVVYIGIVDVALLLLDKGARPGERNKNGWSALHFALRNAQGENARLLLAKGADGLLPSSDGTTAVSLAKKKGYFELLQLLGGDPADAESVFTKAAPGSKSP